MSVPTPDVHGWLDDVTDEDLYRAGIAEGLADGEKPAMVLAKWADEYDVDLTQVHACLQLLCNAPLLLHMGTPLALAAYSPRRQRFRVSIDTDCAPDLADLSFAATATWLTVLAAQEGELPTYATHWSILRLDAAGICGCNQSAVDQYQHYAHLVVQEREADSQMDPYLRLAAQAVWRCAGYALR